jgi:glutamate/tyrosine decarboxylase-like PLP-dependent enzyme
VADLVERCCALARRFADALSASDGVRVLNDVVLNQVLMRFEDHDDVTRRVVAAVRRHVLDGGSDVARDAGDAHLRPELVDRRR